MPSTWDEGFGNVILESYAFRLPVVATNKGRIPECINNFAIGKILDDLEPKNVLDSLKYVYQQLVQKGYGNF